jgi:hypothetical protein
MSFWSAIVIIVAIVAFVNLRMARYRAYGSRHPQPGLIDVTQPSLRESELQREVEDLRERVKVLERIATDDRHSRTIAAEIENLRDK